MSRVRVGRRAGSEKEHARAPVAVPFHLPVAERVASLAAGMFHVLALTSHGRVFAWGKGDYGQLLGLGRPGNWDAPKEVAPLSDKAAVFVAAGGVAQLRARRGRRVLHLGARRVRAARHGGGPGGQAEAHGGGFRARRERGEDRKKKKKIVDAALGGS